MQRELWTREDLRNLLATVQRADLPLRLVPQTPEVKAYRAGHREALDAVATALGVTLPGMDAAQLEGGKE